MGDIYTISNPINILHLEGITYKDILKLQEFSNKLVFEEDTDNNISIDNTDYEKIPRYFTSVRDWKKSTNLSCVNCTLTIGNIPVPVCLNSEYHNNGKNMRYLVSCLFCSFNCAYAHICTNYINDPNKNKYINILKEIYYLFYSKRISVIQPSPNKLILKHYGGSFTPKEYEACITSLQETDKLVSSNVDKMISM